MSVNPFDDEDATFHVLVNDSGQYSLWPQFAAIPAGWTSRLGPVPRQEAVRHVEECWTSLRPQPATVADGAA